MSTPRGIWTPSSGSGAPVALCNVAVERVRWVDIDGHGHGGIGLCGREATHRVRLSCAHGHDKTGWTCDEHSTPDIITVGNRAVCTECGRENPDPAERHQCRVIVIDIERIEQ